MTDKTHRPRSSRFTQGLKRLFCARGLWSIVGVLCVAGLTSVYVFQMAESTRQGYQLRDLEVAVGELRFENEQLGVRVAQQRSLAHVSERMAILGLVPAYDTVYLTAAASVASARYGHHTVKQD